MIIITSSRITPLLAYTSPWQQDKLTANDWSPWQQDKLTANNWSPWQQDKLTANDWSPWQQDKLTANDWSGQQNPSAEKTTLALKSRNFARISSSPAPNITS